MNRYQKKLKGFTLIDTIISFALFSIMLTALYMIIIVSMNNTSKSEEKQKAALYGQQVLEEINNASVNTDKDGLISIKLLMKDKHNKEIVINNNEDYELEDGYKISINATKNDSITLGKKEDVKSYDNLCIYKAKIKWNSSPLEIDAEVNSNTNKEKVSFNNNDKNIVFNFRVYKEENNIIFDLNDNKIIQEKYEEDNSVVKAELNFNDYSVIDNFNKGDENKYKNVKVEVYNELDIPIHLCLVKPNLNMNIETDTMIGKVNLYDNRFDKSNLKELYTIDIKVFKDEKVLFETNVDQNLSASLGSD